MSMQFYDSCYDLYYYYYLYYYHFTLLSLLLHTFILGWHSLVAQCDLNLLLTFTLVNIWLSVCIISLSFSLSLWYLLLISLSLPLVDVFLLIYFYFSWSHLFYVFSICFVPAPFHCIIYFIFAFNLYYLHNLCSCNQHST